MIMYASLTGRLLRRVNKFVDREERKKNRCSALHGTYVRIDKTIASLCNREYRAKVVMMVCAKRVINHHQSRL